MIESELIFWKNGIIDVKYEIETGCEGSVDQYGQKNEPDTPHEMYIKDVRYRRQSVIALFDEDDLENISELIWNKVNSRSVV